MRPKNLARNGRRLSGPMPALVGSMLLSALIAAALTGCESKPAAPPQANSGQAANQPAVNNNAPANNAPANDAPANDAPANQAANNGADEEGPGTAPLARNRGRAAPVRQMTRVQLADPKDVFEVAGADNTFEQVSGPGDPSSPDKYAAVFPAKGTDSSSFDAPISPEGPSTAPPKAETHTAPRTHSPAAGRKLAAKAPDGETPTRVASETTEGEQKKSLPPGFRALTSYGYSSVGWPKRIRCVADGAEMALVTGGAVTVGHDGEPPESSPQITVVLDSFYMDVNEVTLKQFERYRKAINDERGRNAVPEPPNAKSPADFPVLGATLKQCEFYARWAQKELPTEAEWERAARGAAAFVHPWGNGRAIWSQLRKPDTITAVKSFTTDVSPYGIYDLAGNAREWCTDRYSDTAFADEQKSSKTPPRNWKGPRSAQTPDSHVVKGNGPGWNAWHRVGMNGLEHHPDVGFRCVLRLSEKN